MDSESIRDKLFGVGTEVNDESLGDCAAIWLVIPKPSVDDVAEAIAQAHQEELIAADARWSGIEADNVNRIVELEEGLLAARRESAAILPCGHHASNAQEAGGCCTCQLEARVAGMSEALQELMRLSEPIWVQGEGPSEQEWIDAVGLGKQALSAAPKVVGSSSGVLYPQAYFFGGLKSKDVVDLVTLGAGTPFVCERIRPGPGGDPGQYRNDGQQVQVIVLECPRPPEQGAESEQSGDNALQGKAQGPDKEE